MKHAQLAGKIGYSKSLTVFQDYLFIYLFIFFRKIPREGVHPSQNCQKEMPGGGLKWSCW